MLGYLKSFISYFRKDKPNNSETRLIVYDENNPVIPFEGQCFYEEKKMYRWKKCSKPRAGNEFRRIGSGLIEKVEIIDPKLWQVKEASDNRSLVDRLDR